MAPAAPVTVTLTGLAMVSSTPHRGLQTLVHRGEEVLGGEKILVGADEQREVLGHLARLDGLDAHALERLGELRDRRRLVEPAARLQRARPREDRRDRVRGGRLAWLVVAEVSRWSPYH